jgi:hypothetical protein
MQTLQPETESYASTVLFNKELRILLTLKKHLVILKGQSHVIFDHRFSSNYPPYIDPLSTGENLLIWQMASISSGYSLQNIPKIVPALSMIPLTQLFGHNEIPFFLFICCHIWVMFANKKGFCIPLK